MKAIEVQNLSKSFKDVTALDSISLSVDSGAIYGLVGPDGAGKTTLIRILVGIMTALKGTVEVFGEDVLNKPEAD